MRYRVFLDTNVFIYAYEFHKSNSNKIIDLLNKGQIEAVISERVLKEVMAYFKKFYDKDMAATFRDYLLRTCTVVFSTDLKKEIKLYKNQIKDKDLEQLATVKKLGIKFLVSYDRDFENFEEYIIPKTFIKQLGLNPGKPEY
ncbi:MAG: PIN domain protein [Candidatus Scalindua rubra]|uniref:PIN domain protein n=1 Tax=Candidatus Scalindua rubra TaxID=1872076 RepID=A0A1E3X8N6_9BACT|nr:MAG: PIN domain protein [Candidatus Scalindua rubra]